MHRPHAARTQGSNCCPEHFASLSRRGFLSVGLLAGSSLTLPGLLQSRGLAEQKRYPHFQPKAQSIIHIFLPGGMAQQESFDPKPYSPLEYRGDMGTIATALPGVRFNDTLPHTAAIADKITVIRSMTHGEADHNRGTHNMFTGYRPSPAVQYPSLGAVVSHEYGSRNQLPPYVCIPNQPNEFAGSGYLSSSFAPFSLGADPAQANFKVRDLDLPPDVTPERFARRRSVLEAVNSHFLAKEKSDRVGAMNSFYDAAYSLISSPQAREAFDLSKETEEVRTKYGKNQAGSRFLLARRLVEAGVRLVNVTYGSWDHHADLAAGIRSQMPAFDQAFAALVRDLEERGRLNDTLVMVSTEFGRTAKINATTGRDHWPKVFSVALAGGGMKRGLVYGSSNATASDPENDPVSVEDLFTTVYHCLGIVADAELMAPGDRPIEIVDNGKVLNGLLA